ncbi:hypothetical protein H310_07193 [Aphanomyces invadans]|uniref:Uncharacterized protein n=1 Tax=Aphanomyces invadans TaxID=157072 RepID=A0A024U3Z0_9STRA|nr:hypothetical protein H310_07193 [Aphanomyces invadans]ETW00622.1 hypothetical protein H310_07193 [Aphanomyces invadans]|eukprot:XP_008870757.1 hypothetical protein H310_07193 [Aphanomyces invadans]
MEKIADPDGEIKRILDGKVLEAVDRGLSAAQEDELRRILKRHVGVFRLDFGRELPVDVEPLKVRLKEVHSVAVSVKCAMRSYPPAHMDFLKKHVKSSSLARLQKQSCDMGGSAANRGEENSGRGYWQLPLHPSCQMWYSFMTSFGGYTPTRILMCQTDAVAFCQTVVNQMFGELLYAGVLGWLGDLLGYADSVDKLIVLLDKVPAICEKGLCALETPVTGADLQQFVCATNWMRSSIPNYAELIGPLRQLLDVAAKAAGGSKKTALARTKLAAVGWAAEHDDCFAAVKETLQRMQGFHLFANPRNLLYIFNPLGYNSNMARYQAHKLQRWAMVMTSFPYTLEHVAGEDNVWAKLLSRWVSPLQDNDFTWPTAATILEVLQPARSTAGEHAVEDGVTWSDHDGFFLTVGGEIWIPPGGVVERFDWPNIKEDVKAFVSSCLHCLCVDGTMLPPAEMVPPRQPAEVLCDSALDVADDLKENAAFGDEGFFVEALLGAARCAEGKYEVRVK